MIIDNTSPKCISTLKTGNAPVAPLVFHGFVGSDGHLPSGDPNARYHFHEKKAVFELPYSKTPKLPQLMLKYFLEWGSPPQAHSKPYCP